MVKSYIIVPVYNESAEILNLLLHDLIKMPFETIVIDDGSSIPVKTIIKLPVTIITHRINLGQGAAIQTGLSYARIKNADYVITIDADGQHMSSEIPLILQPLMNNETDVVFGSRFLEGSYHNASARKRIAFRIASWVNKVFIHMPITDTHNGFRGFNKTAISKINLTENRMAHATELLVQVKKSGLRFKEVPVSVRYTEYSRKKGQKGVDSIRIFLDLLLYKFFE
ncbi:MAG TPA: glycosyltransferase family 2 protein [Flavisolibacter sp.]|nr:glycosyltransferase family 2 protein [Flavisolibacter sp.]